jgi:hypothetical protein
MNIVKKLAIATTFLCAATTVNAEDGMKIGGTVNYITMQPGGDGGKDADMSFLGAGVGVALQIPLGSISVNPEVLFLYRQLYSLTTDLGPLGKFEYNEHEFAISVPVTVRYNVSDAYVGGGVQLDLPLAAKLQTKVSGTPGGLLDIDESVDFKDRASLDLGIAIVAGYNISESIAAGAKTVIGLTEVAKDSKMTFNQYSVGVTYFF